MASSVLVKLAPLCTGRQMGTEVGRQCQAGVGAGSLPSWLPSWLPPATLLGGKYRFDLIATRHIKVFLVSHRISKSKRVCKIVKRDTAVVSVDKIMEEVRTMAKLDHPNVVRVSAGSRSSFLRTDFLYSESQIFFRPTCL